MLPCRHAESLQQPLAPIGLRTLFANSRGVRVTSWSNNYCIGHTLHVIQVDHSFFCDEPAGIVCEVKCLVLLQLAVARWHKQEVQILYFLPYYSMNLFIKQAQISKTVDQRLFPSYFYHLTF